jgi:hypothetical protein
MAWRLFLLDALDHALDDGGDLLGVMLNPTDPLDQDAQDLDG